MTAPALRARLRHWANAGMAAGTLFAGVVLVVVYIWLVSPWLRDHMGGERLLDEMPWRTPADVDAMLSAYGESGRAFYRRVLMGDLLSPLVYVPPLMLSIAFASPKLGWLRRHARIAPLLPILGGLFDWGENLTLLILTGQFPNQRELPGWIAMVMTLLKFAALVVSGFVILLGLLAYRRESEKPSSRSNHQSR